MDSHAAWDPAKAFSDSFVERKQFCVTFEKDGLDAYGSSLALRPSDLLQLGYENADADCLLVYAVIEDVGIGLRNATGMCVRPLCAPQRTRQQNVHTMLRL